MAVTPAMVAVRLGVAAPASDSAQFAQWSMWIADAELLINARAAELDVVPDPAKVDYVVREAVASQVLRPDDATTVTVAVDDASTSRTYKSSSGRVAVLDEWWSLLGLVGESARAFSITPSRSTTAHMPWCSLMLGALYCSCGADLTAYEYPLYEGGVLTGEWP